MKGGEDKEDDKGMKRSENSIKFLKLGIFIKRGSECLFH